jgi:hypothetical protein
MTQVDTSSENALNADDAAASLALTAARTQRRNQPQFLVLLGVLALVGAAVWTTVKWSASRAAADRADAARSQAQRAMEAVAKLQAYGAASQNAGPAVAPANIRSTIESAGTRAGLSKAVGVGSQSTSRTGDDKWNQVKYAYTLRDESLAAMLRWVEIVKQDVPDLEVSAMTVVPEANEWRLTVTYVRFERKAEGSAT